MLPPEIDLKEQLAEARRTQIVMGAAQVFAEKGFHKATTKEIAKAAGVSEGTIYNYFQTKRDLLVAMVDQIGMQSLKRLMLDNPPADPRALITAIMRDRFELAQSWGIHLAPILAEVFTDVELREVLYRQIAIPITAHIEKHIQNLMDTGQLRPADPVIVTRTLIGAVVFNFILKITGLDPRYQNYSVDALIEQIVSVVFDGLLAAND